MTTHQEIIDHHVSEMERLFGGKILKFSIDYDADKTSAEDLSETLFKQRAMDFMHRQIDPLTLALAKVERYEELIKSLCRDLGRFSIEDWLAMSEGEENLRHEIFRRTEMKTFGNPEHDIDFARRNGFTFNKLKKV